MQRTASWPGPAARLVAVAIALVFVAAAVPATAQEDPWKILEGTYRFPEGYRPPAPQTSEGTEPPPVAQVFGSTGKEWLAIEEAYRQLLERLAEDDRPALLRAVGELEVAAIGEAPERRIPRLMRTELEVARRLAQQDPEILVPIFQLHHDLYMEHRRGRQWYLLLHTVSTVRELAAIYVDEAGTTGARMTAARMLASLAGYLQAGQQPASVGLYEEVLELDPKNESAYLGLAAHYEKRGGPCERVVPHLRRLLEVYPEHREGRLRLAVNLLRMAKEEEAEKLFGELLAEPGDDWVYRLAAQEMARFEARRGPLDAAIAVLEKAVERAPGDQKLNIQLSFFYDRGRQSFNARRAAERARAGRPALEAPRGRYNTWPHEALDHDRAELRRLAESRVQLLAELLGHERPPKAAPPEGEIHP